MLVKSQGSLSGAAQDDDESMGNGASWLDAGEVGAGGSGAAD
jgi:hypothetical protein